MIQNYPYNSHDLPRFNPLIGHITSIVLIISFSSLLMTRMSGVPYFSFIDEIMFFGAFFTKIALGFFYKKTNLIVIIYLSSILILTLISMSGAYSVLGDKNIISSILFLKIFIIIYLSYSLKIKDLNVIVYWLFWYSVFGVLFSILFPGFIYSMVKTTSAINPSDTSSEISI